MTDKSKKPETGPMKHKALFQGLVCTLLVSSAFYIRYRTDAGKALSVETCAAGGKTPYAAGLTLSDLAETIYESAGEKNPSAFSDLDREMTA